MMRVWTRRRKSKRSSRCSILARVQSRGQRRKTTPEMARERPKPKPCEKRLPPWLDDRADGFRRRDADGCDRDGRAPQASARESGEANNLRLCSLMFAYVRLIGKKCRGAAREVQRPIQPDKDKNMLRACYINRPVRGPGLQGFGILAISRRPRALTRRPPTILKHALRVAGREVRGQAVHARWSAMIPRRDEKTALCACRRLREVSRA